MLESKIGLGTVQFGMAYGISNKNGQTSNAEVAQILKLAKDNNILILDSASAYGNSEEVLGENDLSCFNIISKFMPPKDGRSILIQFEESLKSLGVNSIYGYLAHRPLNLIENPSRWAELSKIKSSNRVQKIGFSLNEPSELSYLLEKNLIPDLVQVPYNYFDRRFENEIIKLKQLGCEIHTRSTFLQGLFFMSPEDLSDFFDEIKPSLGQLQKISTLNGALLRFVLEKDFVDKTIIGVENVNQLKDNIKSIQNTSALPDLENHINEDILIPSRWPTN
ncbi:aldo/keto reductase [Gramella sp. MAR_2010_147]|uniref:aldo/keto reductase n=1 Tax=Gramella sp. MAR_2010_147 TaxID=1250205 RepID=UPI00087CCEEE|nr:aldo/keto reductase [Gramella sp. MAR_2010_147]SDR69495.1 Predicted oxidoreductase [Gramella sp. MAR_2010_147]